MTDLHGVMPAPCKSCPYRRDVPSGVWAQEEYEKLPAYDGQIAAQAHAGASALFLCHQQNGCLCAGWLAAHGPYDLLAMRLNAARVDPAAFDYETDVPVWPSGQEARDHGVRDLENVQPEADRVIQRLMRARRRRG